MRMQDFQERQYLEQKNRINQKAMLSELIRFLMLLCTVTFLAERERSCIVYYGWLRIMLLFGFHHQRSRMLYLLHPPIHRCNNIRTFF